MKVLPWTLHLRPINKKINDILAWIVDNVECKWSIMIDQGSLSFSFDDLQTATLFRLRF
jgi:hypothetical protein